MPRRIVLLFVIILLLWSGLVLRSVYLQIIPNQKLSQRQQKQFQTAIMLEPRRGSLIDRNGKDLASSVAAFSVFADPHILESPRQASRKLAPILGQTRNSIYEKIKQQKKRFVWLARKLDAETKAKIEGLGIRGIGFIEESKRIYPNIDVLSQTLGFVGANGMGLEGLELQLNDLLSGNNKKVEIKKDARGTPLILNGQMFLEKQDGYDVQLTIDLELQYVLEQELKYALESNEAESAVGIILDANTSEILAMSSYPTFNANKFASASQWLRRNRVVTDPFEPGSTMKTFTIATALQEKQFHAGSKIYGEKGRMKVADKWIRESNHRGHEWLTVTEVLAKSSNIGTAKIGFQLGDKRLYQGLKKFGFGERSSLDLPGESRGILSQPKWRQHKLSNISFGHAMAATPLQVANAYAAIANGGILHRPYIVKKVIDNKGEIIKEVESEKIRRVLSPLYAKEMRKMLAVAASKKGTGWKASIDGFRVAGKTGTAQKVNPNGLGYMSGAYISSFAGFVPYEQPKYVIFIAVDHPKKSYYGSDVVAPVFSRLASYAMLRSGMAPTIFQSNTKDVKPQVRANLQKTAVNKVQRLNDKEQMPDLIGLNIRESIDLLRNKGVKVKVYGEGLVKKTLPESGAEIKSQQTVNLILTKEL